MKRRHVRAQMAAMPAKEWVRRQRTAMDRNARLSRMRAAGFNPDSPADVRRWVESQRATKS